MTKTCSRCALSLPTDLFNKRQASKDGFGTYCRTCQHIIYRTYRLTHKEELRKARARYRTRNKEMVLAKYGNGKPICVLCGESRSACLSLDHVNNDGAEDRRQGRLTSWRLYAQLKAHGFPPGFQTLCMNCQFIKREQYVRRIKEEHGNN